MDSKPNSLYSEDTSPSALAALSLLNTYQHLLLPPLPAVGSTDLQNPVAPLLGSPAHCLPPHLPHLGPCLTSPLWGCEVSSRGGLGGRSTKRPTPAALKDDKYFERRRRNNLAAKKSRDARRIREDQIAWRACLLEQENASLRAHVASLRQEALALRSLLASRDEPLLTTRMRDEPLLTSRIRNEPLLTTRGREDLSLNTRIRDEPQINIRRRDEPCLTRRMRDEIHHPTPSSTTND